MCGFVNEVYVLEKYDKIKDCYVFYNVVESYASAKKCIYAAMAESSNIASDPKISITDGQVNENDYFTVSCSFSDYPTITDKFRGHPVIVGMTNNYYLDRYNASGGML